MLLQIARKLSASTVVPMATLLDTAKEIANPVDEVCSPTSSI
jgi:BioD-like phosphotransacetylase family protein